MQPTAVKISQYFERINPRTAPRTISDNEILLGKRYTCMIPFWVREVVPLQNMQFNSAVIDSPDKFPSDLLKEKNTDKQTDQ